MLRRIRKVFRADSDGVKNPGDQKPADQPTPDKEPADQPTPDQEPADQPSTAPIVAVPSLRDRNLLQVLAYALPPGVLATALGFWFGWTFTDGQANYFGLDASTLGFTTTDYLARSPNAVFVPAAVLLVGWLTLIALHAGVSRWMVSGRAAGLLIVVALACVITGCALLVLALYVMVEPLFDYYLLPPIVLGTSALMVGYGLWMLTARQVAHSLLRIPFQSGSGSATPDLRSTDKDMSSPRWVPTGRIVIVLLVVLSIFWATSLYARALGNGRAAALANALAERPVVTVYSKYSLALEADGVTRERIADPESPFLFRHTGFRLLVHSGDKYFLLPEHWTFPEGSEGAENDKPITFVLRDTPDIRIEFSPGG